MPNYLLCVWTLGIICYRIKNPFGEESAEPSTLKHPGTLHNEQQRKGIKEGILRNHLCGKPKNTARDKMQERIQSFGCHPELTDQFQMPAFLAKVVSFAISQNYLLKFLKKAFLLFKESKLHHSILVNGLIVRTIFWDAGHLDKSLIPSRDLKPHLHVPRKCLIYQSVRFFGICSSQLHLLKLFCLEYIMYQENKEKLPTPSSQGFT